MTNEEMKIDALLITATGRLMRAAAVTGEMRVALAIHDTETAIRASHELAEHMEVIESTFGEVTRITWKDRHAQRAIEPIACRQQKGLVH